MKVRAPRTSLPGVEIRPYPLPVPGSPADIQWKTASLSQYFEADSLGQESTRRPAISPDCWTPFRGSGYMIGPEDYWAYRCTASFRGGRLTSYSYLLAGATEPTTERRVWTVGPRDSLDASATRELAKAMTERLWSHFGPPKSLAVGSLLGPASGSRQDAVEFATASGTLWLYRLPSSGSSRPDSFVVEHWSARLLSEANRDLPTGQFGEAHEPGLPVAETYGDVSKALTARWPAFAATLRLKGSLVKDAPIVHQELLLARDPRMSPSQRDLLRYGAHLWLKGCSHLPGWDAGDSATVRPILASLRRFGIHIARSREGDWCYDGALADSLASHVGENRWADLAFVELLDRGWESPCALCGWDKPFGPDLFKPVIEHGEAYLVAHPQSEVADAVVLRVAEAHETAWSLSKVAPGDDYIDPKKYLSGAPRHRQRALELYDRFLKGKPATSEPEIRERLQRMRRDIDTDFHKYWCLWD